MPVLPTGMVRNNNGRYYLRRRIPQDLIASYGNKKEILRSLETADYSEALTRFRLLDAKLMLEWERRRQRRAEFAAARQIEAAIVINELSQDDIDRICQHYEATGLAGDENRRVGGNYDISEVEGYQVDYPDGIAAMKAAVAIGDFAILGPILQQFLDLYNYQVNIPESDFRRLAIAFGRAAIRTNDKLLRRFQGEDIRTPEIANRKQHKLSELISNYDSTYPKAKKAAMYKKIGGVLPMFLEIVGDKPIQTIRQSDINRFFEVVQMLPPRWKDIARQRKITVSEVAQLNLGEMSPGTFEGTYKAVITPFLKWAYTNWQDRGFPTTLTTQMITYMGSREEGENHQRAFRLDELKRLFLSPQMRVFADGIESAHQYWLPVLGLFTGARVNELCQINPQVDIRQDADSKVWFFDITEDSEAADNVTKSVKTAPSKRKVPIHSKLIQLGFLDYVFWVRGKGDRLLFARFPASKGRASVKAMKWFGEFLDEVGLRDDTPGARLVGMHAFRSTFLNRANNLQVVNAEAITGHAQVTSSITAVQDGQIAGNASAVVRRYQGELDLKIKSEIIERITWDIPFVSPRKPPKLPV